MGVDHYIADVTGLDQLGWQFPIGEGAGTATFDLLLGYVPEDAAEEVGHPADEAVVFPHWGQIQDSELNIDRVDENMGDILDQFRNEHDDVVTMDNVPDEGRITVGTVRMTYGSHGDRLIKYQFRDVEAGDHVELVAQ